MRAESNAAANEQLTSTGGAALKLHRSPFRRSKLGSNPRKAVSLNTVRGRLIHDIAARLLAGVADPDNPLIVADCLALAELRVRADELRRDPASDPNVVVKLEGLVDRRMRRLGLGLERKRAEAPVETYAELSARLAADAHERRRLELEEDEAHQAETAAPEAAAPAEPAGEQPGTGPAGEEGPPA
jgi:hypothetical protein